MIFAVYVSKDFLTYETLAKTLNSLISDSKVVYIESHPFITRYCTLNGIEYKKVDVFTGDYHCVIFGDYNDFVEKYGDCDLRKRVVSG